jgi:hypothetical protein
MISWRKSLLRGFILLVISLSLSSAFLPTKRLIQMLTDDSSYYFLIADNFVRGYGFTFDRLGPTNGFQPLWQAVLVLLRMAFSLEPEGFIRVVVTVGVLLMSTSSYFFWKTARQASHGRASSAGVMVFLALVFLKFGTGMETPLVALLVTALIEILARKGSLQRCSIRDRVIFGVLLGALVLARLDSIFFAGSLLICGWWELRPRIPSMRQSQGIFQILMITALLVMPDLLFNFQNFGHILPISGAIKSSFPVPGWYFPEFHLGLIGQATFLISTGSALVFLALRWSAKGHTNGFQAGLAALSMGILSHHAFSVFFMKWAVCEWHFVIGRIFLAYFVVYLLDQNWSWSWAQKGAAAILTILSATMISVYAVNVLVRKPEKAWHVTSYNAAVWARTFLPKSSILAMKDSGNFGYFSGLRVVNLDGIVNNFAYQEELRRGNLARYLHSRGVQYLVQHAFWDQNDINSGKYVDYMMYGYSHLYDCTGGYIRLFRRDEVYRSPKYYDGQYRTVFIIWKIDWNHQVKPESMEKQESGPKL